MSLFNRLISLIRKIGFVPFVGAVGFLSAAAILADRIAYYGGMIVHDCQDLPLFPDTMWTFVPPIVGIGFFGLVILANYITELKDMANVGLYIGIPIAGQAINKMAIGTSCPWCVILWCCFFGLLATRIISMWNQATIKLTRGLVVSTLFFASGSVSALTFQFVPVPIGDDCNGQDACDYRPCTNVTHGGSYRQDPDLAEGCTSTSSPGCGSKDCIVRHYVGKGCPPPDEITTYNRRACRKTAVRVRP